ncbi:MAG: DUF4743 domain-containing protein [Planctomycetes bacterium]|nr:DUF4743 domain-containing protein [Planctomycetota bacterium]
MILAALLARIAVCHRADPSAFEPWFVDGIAVGRIHRERVPLVERAPTPFRRDGDRLVVSGADYRARTDAFEALAQRLAVAGELASLLGERYGVAGACRTPLLEIDRAAVAWFGVSARGVHLNGFVHAADGLRLWVARRARGKRTFPGRLDNLVAGGSSVGFADAATLRKECHEEAGVPVALAERAVPVGELRYDQQDGKSWKADTLACFDLELPADFMPRPVDGEVESFALWPVAKVVSSLAGDDLWKPNSALVATHFLLRHGALDAAIDDAGRSLLWRAFGGASG